MNMISINSQLRDFGNYLNINERCIFSARFGDGKSYFLSKFIEENNENYFFIPIYPVNYQIADNKDIFEYIKRDILIRLLSSGEIEIDDTKISNSCFIYRFFAQNGISSESDSLKLLSSLNISDINFNGFDLNPEKILIVCSAFNKIKEEFIKNKSQFKSDEKKAQELIEIDNYRKGSIYEFDAISQLICDLIDQYRQKYKNRKVVLLIEDLDRIDPAHIFRILNIFSAHFDRYNKSWNELKTQGEFYENKFKFDKIVTVCDYNNIKNIYHHCYGHKTDFAGYIGKYSTSKPFVYSLEERIKDYIIQNIDDDLRVYTHTCDALASLILSKYCNTSQGLWGNIRFIKHNLHKKHNIREEYIEIIDDLKISSVNTLTKLLDILNRFELNWNDLFNYLETKTRFEKNLIINECWLCSIFYNKNLNIKILDENYEDYILIHINKALRIPINIEGNIIKKISVNKLFDKSTYTHETLVNQIESTEMQILEYFNSFITNSSNNIL